MNILIDTKGKIWDADAGRLRLHFHAPITSKALPEYLVRNMGFISLKIDRDTAVIRGTPSNISYASYSVAVELLEDRPLSRAALMWFDGGWHDNTFFGSDVGKAKKQLLSLMLSQPRRANRHYISYPRSIRTMSAKNQHGRLFAYWQSKAGRIDQDADAEAISELTSGKFLVVRDHQNGQLSFSAIGKGLIVYRDTTWVTQFQGGPVEEQPDYNYGTWVANGYRDAFAHRRPQLSDFDAVVRDARNGNSQHHRYSRLLLPITSASGELQLLSAPRADTSIDLSLEAV